MHQTCIYIKMALSARYILLTQSPPLHSCTWCSYNKMTWAAQSLVTELASASSFYMQIYTLHKLCKSSNGSDSTYCWFFQNHRAYIRVCMGDWSEGLLAVTFCENSCMLLLTASAKQVDQHHTHSILITCVEWIIADHERTQIHTDKYLSSIVQPL